VLDEHLLAAAVAAVHAADLRDRLVRLVDDQEEVPREVVHRHRRRIARARGPRSGASSSRCRDRSPSARASRGRRACAARGAASRRASSRSESVVRRSCSSTLIVSIARRLSSSASRSATRGRSRTCPARGSCRARGRSRRCARSRRRTSRCGSPCSPRPRGTPRRRRRARGRCRGEKSIVVALVLDRRRASGGGSSRRDRHPRAHHEHLDVRLARAEAVDAAHRGDDDHVVARQQRLRVAEWRMRSILSLMMASFSM
jgi:hypothetical protein